MYFFDTYAFFEIINANPRYQQFTKETITTSVLNLGELYYHLIRNGNKTRADEWFFRLHASLIEFDTGVMCHAMAFRYLHKSKNLSVPDCVGYLIAQKHGLKFLTGDKEFQNMPNVEFVK